MSKILPTLLATTAALLFAAPVLAAVTAPPSRADSPAQVCAPDGFRVVSRNEFRHENARLRICLKEGWAFGCDAWGTPREYLVQATKFPDVVYAGLGVGATELILYYCLPAQK